MVAADEDPDKKFFSEGHAGFVEAALGHRVVRRTETEAKDVQVQRLDKRGKASSVRPGSELELQMFDMLCTPPADWYIYQHPKEQKS